MGLEPQPQQARRFRVLLAVGVAAAVLLTTLAVAVPWLLRDRQPAAPNPTPTPVAIGELPPPLVPSALASPSAAPSASNDAVSAQPSVKPTTPRSAAAPAAGGANAPSYGTPAESEEFTGSGLDKSTWGEYEGAIDNGARWTPDLAVVTGGELQVSGAGRNSSGAGNTAGGVCWRCTGSAHTYGVWQLRARFDAGVGYDPVIGLGPAKGDMGELGWITLVHTFTPARTSAAYLVNGPGGKGVDGSSAADYTAWHTYTIEWRSSFVKMYRDGTLMIDTTGRSVTPPNVPMYMFIQMEAGPNGSMPGPNSSTPDRVTMHVDWVKYFN